jgi:hypothetical protein
MRAPPTRRRLRARMHEQIRAGGACVSARGLASGHDNLFCMLVVAKGRAEQLGHKGKRTASGHDNTTCQGGGGLSL